MVDDWTRKPALTVGRIWRLADAQGHSERSISLHRRRFYLSLASSLLFNFTGIGCEQFRVAVRFLFV